MLTEGAGQWRRAGMDGTVVGLDLAACLARPQAADGCAAALEVLLVAGEAAALTAIHRAADERR